MEGNGQVRAALGAALGAALSKLDRIGDLLQESLESEPDVDIAYTFSGTFSTASATSIQLPRTVHHAELTLSVGAGGTGGSVALFDGQQTLAYMQGAHQNTTLQPSGAICTAGPGSVTVREYLGGSGFLSLLVLPAANTTWSVTVRIRSLDKSQLRERRT